MERLKGRGIGPQEIKRLNALPQDVQCLVVGVTSFPFSPYYDIADVFGHSNSSKCLDA
jgi:hypothetical protein